MKATWDSGLVPAQERLLGAKQELLDRYEKKMSDLVEVKQGSGPTFLAMNSLELFHPVPLRCLQHRAFKPWNALLLNKRSSMMPSWKRNSKNMYVESDTLVSSPAAICWVWSNQDELAAEKEAAVQKLSTLLQEAKTETDQVRSEKEEVEVRAQRHFSGPMGADGSHHCNGGCAGGTTGSEGGARRV